MKQPEGFVEVGFEDHVAKLIHTIYRMMQGGHDWYETLSTTYNELDYTTSRADPCVRIKEENGNYTITNTYTDNTFGASNNKEEEKKRKDEIARVWDKRQATVALSTVEAEYVAMSRCAQQMVWMQNWLSEANIEYAVPGIIKGDNRGAIALTKNTKDHGKVKHIDIRHHYIWELVQSGALTMEQVSSADNLADMFTKPLSRDHHHRLLTALNIY